MRKSSLGDDSHPIFSTAGVTNLRVNFFNAFEIALSSEKTALTVAREPRTCDHTRWFVSFWNPSTKARRPGVAASPERANAPASPIIPGEVSHSNGKIMSCAPTDLVRNAQSFGLSTKLSESCRWIVCSIEAGGILVNFVERIVDLTDNIFLLCKSNRSHLLRADFTLETKRDPPERKSVYIYGVLGR